ncbi:IGEB protein, partial [Brachypodius atriceps]|nr:IGEB protein [Brachypodius atriceps]
VEHKKGIPHSPTGQAVVERSHRDNKWVLDQQQQILKQEPPSIRLAKALFTINFLNCSFDNLNPPIVRHFGGAGQLALKAKPPVLVKDLESGRVEGP